MNENDLIKRIEELEKDNARLRKIEKELKNTVKGFNKLIATNNIMLKEIKSQKVELVKDSISFKHLFQSYNEKDWHILKHMEAFWGDVPNWNKITDDSLADFQNFLRSQKKRIGEGLLSETTIALYMNLIKGTIKRGYSPRTNGGQNVKVLKAAKKKKVWLRPNDLQEIADYTPINDAELYAKKMYLISAITGARISDVEHLSSANIDGYTLRYIPIKTKDFEASVSLTVEAKNYLNELFDIQVERLSDINPVIRDICRKCGITRTIDIGTPNRPNVVELCDAVHVHTFRHSFATIKYRYSGWSEKQISTSMGHANISMTLNNYVLDKSAVSEQELKENKNLIF